MDVEATKAEIVGYDSVNVPGLKELVDSCAEGPNQELWIMFNKLWTRSASGGPYIKKDWVRLEHLIMNYHK